MYGVNIFVLRPQGWHSFHCTTVCTAARVHDFVLRLIRTCSLTKEISKEALCLRKFRLVALVCCGNYQVSYKSTKILMLSTLARFIAFLIIMFLITFA